MKLQNRTFIITGATSGMGRAMALEFSREGAKLILSGRNEEAAEELLSLLQTEAYFLAGDVSDPGYNQRLVELALEKFGQLDGLLTNAGMLGLGSITDLPLETWTQTFNVNLTSVFSPAKSIPSTPSKKPQCLGGNQLIHCRFQILSQSSSLLCIQSRIGSFSQTGSG